MISKHDSDGMEANWGGYFEMSGLELVSPRDFSLFLMKGSIDSLTEQKLAHTYHSKSHPGQCFKSATSPECAE
jgi:hypothetical protein